MMLGIFPWPYLLFIYFLWRNVCSDHFLKLFICWLCWVFVAASGLSLAAVRCFLLQGWALECKLQQLWHVGLDHVDLPIPGIEPLSPAQGGRFSTTGPPGKSLTSFLVGLYSYWAMRVLYILGILYQMFGKYYLSLWSIFIFLTVSSQEQNN